MTDPADKTEIESAKEPVTPMFRKQRATALKITEAEYTEQLTPEVAVEQLCGILLGKEHKVQLCIACLLAGGHLLIEDIPGVGKTTLAQALGLTLGLSWNRLQFTSDLLPADVVGVSIYNSENSSFEFKPGPIFTSILLADEINRAPPKAQSALLEAMEEKQVSIDGQTMPLPENFFVIATQNPADNMGAYALPESQLDRFLAAIDLGYPDSQTERQLLKGGGMRQQMQNLSPVANPELLIQWQTAATQITVSDKLLDYVQALLEESRKQQRVANGHKGLSPRAGLNLLAMAKAWALLQKRTMVLPEDVQAVFTSVAGHRISGDVSSGQTQAKSVLDAVALNQAHSNGQSNGQSNSKNNN